VHVFELLGVERPAAGADAVLDGPAKAAYRVRLADLDEEIAAADADRDLGRAARHRAERDFLVRELAAATGLGGRSRLLGDETERARKTVLARIRHVLARLDRVHPALAAHLAGSIRTGTRCAYLPAEPTTWATTAGREPASQGAGGAGLP
jgi:hypothetical protein